LKELVEIKEILLDNKLDFNGYFPSFQECQKSGTFVAKKYFSIDRVFRNETLDATHLAEFHQVRFVALQFN
jgi:phenylalanyl-tRNA synthetase alpha chain